MKMATRWLADNEVALPAGFPLDSEYVGTTYFPRILQLDDHSCYARSVQATLQHFGRRTSYTRILKELRTTEEGTDEAPAVRLLRSFNLRVRPRARMTFTELWNALWADAVVFTYLDGDHVGVVYGASADYVFLADPSIGKAALGRVPRKVFMRRWDKSGLIVRD
jgi:ABC-type bacteriocin/lantibiotic exporter with double-glycine peptidase domain